MSEGPPEIFDRQRQIAMRQRGWARTGGRNFMWDRIADEFAERLAAVTHDFGDILFLGPMSAYAADILKGRTGTVTCAPPDTEEDRLPYPLGSFDLIVCGGTLDSVNDLPGALIQMRRALRPDGLLLAHMFGAGTLYALKTAMLDADGQAASAHIHPQIELRSAADLLSRAGFTLPVADMDTEAVRYSDWRRLVADLRDMGIGNALATTRPIIDRGYTAKLNSAWNAQIEDGKVTENFVHLHLSGWAPSENQPKPARRGSGKTSLAAILPPPKN